MVDFNKLSANVKASLKRIAAGDGKNKKVIDSQTEFNDLSKLLANCKNEDDYDAVLELKVNYQKRLKNNANRIARGFYQIADDNAGWSSVGKMYEFLEKNVDSNNIVALLDEYKNPEIRKNDSSIIDTVTSETGASSSNQRKVLIKILETLCEAARKAGVSEKDISSARKAFTESMQKEFEAYLRRINPKDMEKALDFLRGAILAKQNQVAGVNEDKAMKSVASSYQQTNSIASRKFEKARKEEGWTAKTGDWVCGLFGCNTEDELRAKLGDNAGKVDRLMKAANSGKKAEFKKVYKELFGIEFDANKVAAAQKYSEEFEAAQSAGMISKAMGEVLSKAGRLDYKGLVNLLKTKLKYDDNTINQILSQYSQNFNMPIKTAEQKRAVLEQFLATTKKSCDSQLKVLLKGETLEQKAEKAELLAKSAYGINDIAKDVAQFNDNMVMTELVTDAAFEIAGTVALQFVPGLGQAAAAKLAVSAAKWGTKATKLVRYAQKAENAFAATNKFLKGGKFTSKVAQRATQVGAQMTNAGVATSAVGLSSGKDLKTVVRKTVMNMSFAGVGATSSVIAPKLMQAFGINKQLATEIAEELINAAGSYGVTTAAGDKYGSADFWTDMATGIIMSRLTHVKGGKGKANVKTEPEVKSEPMRSLTPDELTLKNADLDDEAVQLQMLESLEKEFPSTRRVPGRVSTLKKMQTLLGSPEYLQMDDLHKQMAKLIILKSNPRIDSRALFDDINLPIELKRKLISIDSCIQPNADPNIAAGLYSDDDFKTMITIAKIQGVDEATIKQMQTAFTSAQANGALLVHQTHVQTENIPARAIEKDGKAYNIKVLDCTDSDVFKNPAAYGLPAGTTPENLRLTVHMNDGINQDPLMTVGQMRARDNLNLSASITDGKNALYADSRFGLLLDYDMGSVGYASNYAAGTGFGKNLGDFAQAKLNLNDSSTGTFVREKFVEHMNEQGISFTKEDYMAFSRLFKDTNVTMDALHAAAKNGFVEVNGKQVSLESLEKSLLSSTDDLMSVSYEMRGQVVDNGLNEINIYNPDIKAIYVRARSADETLESILSPRLLDYIQKRGLPIVFQRISD